MLDKDHSRTHNISDAERAGIKKWILQAVAGWFFYALILILSAGSFTWRWAWILLVILGAMLASHPLLLLPINPSLLAERSKGLRAKGVKNWDQWLTISSTICMLAGWVVAGLDERFGWSGLPIAWHIFGAVLMVIGYAIFMWAMASNAFFAEGVRIQTERQHTVCTRGPYRVVRHPGYVGSILSQAATPLLLGSTWAVIPTLIFIALFVVRTWLEDKTLMKELPGYVKYALSTPYRLIPGIW